ncbi:MAG: hypothetical protein Q9210_000571 [Variospora velana]
MTFKTPIFHPNIYSSGEVCISILHPPEEDKYGYESASERWSPVQTPETILLSVISMLSSPNDESPANVEAARMWREDEKGVTKKQENLRGMYHAELGMRQWMFSPGHASESTLSFVYSGAIHAFVKPGDRVVVSQHNQPRYLSSSNTRHISQHFLDIRSTKNTCPDQTRTVEHVSCSGALHVDWEPFDTFAINDLFTKPSLPQDRTRWLRNHCSSCTMETVASDLALKDKRLLSPRNMLPPDTDLKHQDNQSSNSKHSTPHNMSSTNTHKNGKENANPAGNNKQTGGQPAKKDPKKTSPSGGSKEGDDADRHMKFLGISNEHSAGQYSPEGKK